MTRGQGNYIRRERESERTGKDWTRLEESSGSLEYPEFCSLFFLVNPIINFHNFSLLSSVFPLLLI